MLRHPDFFFSFWGLSSLLNGLDGRGKPNVNQQRPVLERFSKNGAPPRHAMYIEWCPDLSLSFFSLCPLLCLLPGISRRVKQLACSIPTSYLHRCDVHRLLVHTVHRWDNHDGAFVLSWSRTMFPAATHVCLQQLTTLEVSRDHDSEYIASRYCPIQSRHGTGCQSVSVRIRTE